MFVADELIKIYQKNLLFFQKNYPDVFTKLNSLKENSTYDLIIEDEGYFNIEHIASGNKIYSSNSEQISQLQVDELLTSTKKIDKIVFSGSLLGFQIEKLILTTDIKCIMIIEPNIEFFKFSTFLIDYEILTKNRFTIFSIQDSEEEIENRFLEFAFTMFYYNKSTSFLNSTPSYTPIVDFVKNIVKNNIAHELTHLPDYIPELKNINMIDSFQKAQKEEEKNDFYRAVQSYLDIVEYERYHELDNEAKKYILLSYLALGNIFYSQLRTAEAFHCYGKCVFTKVIVTSVLEPALHNLAMINKNSRQNYKKMVTLLSKHLNKNPKNIQLAILLSEYLFQLNRYEVAQSILDSYKDDLIKAKRVEGFLPSIPIVYQSQTEIDTFREKLENTLDTLLAQKISIPENNLTLVNAFYLAYHNKNNVSLLTKLSNFYTQVTPSLTYESNHCRDYKFNERKIKLGIVSNYMIPEHPVMKFMKNILETFANLTQYDVHLFSFSNKTPEFEEVKTHLITTTINKTREVISKHQLDIIVYPEIWMHAPTYFLAHARLAPIQCMFGGHPMTSGIKNIDYYFSQKDLEIQGAQAHYREELVLFENFVSSYTKPQKNEYISKDKLGLNNNKNNYLIPAKLQKIHPDFDEILNLITKNDDKANLIFFKDSSESNWDKFVEERLLKKIPEQCITFLKWADTEVFHSLLHHADAVLEPTVFGYGTTAMEAFSIATPIVTLPGNFPTGRIVKALYQKLSFFDLIAINQEDYALKSVKLATDDAFKHTCQTTILNNSQILYENNTIVEEMNSFFKSKLL